jgi:hypothetical protein
VHNRIEVAIAPPLPANELAPAPVHDPRSVPHFRELMRKLLKRKRTVQDQRLEKRQVMRAKVRNVHCSCMKLMPHASVIVTA